MTELTKLLNKIQKETPNLIVNSREANNSKSIILDSPGLNYVFGGKFTTGRIYSLFGPFSGGKSTLANYLAGQHQKKFPEDHRVIIYADFERSFNYEYATQNGLDCSDLSSGGNLLYLQPDSMEDFFDTVTKMIETNNIACIIFDSESAAPTKTAMIDSVAKSSMGKGAGVLTNGLKKLNILCANYNTTLIIISQERANYSILSKAITTTGGFALPYFSAWRGRITKIETIEEKGETIGQKIKVRSYKNKVGIPFRTSELNLYFKGGFDTDSEYLDFAINLGIIKQGGAWFTSDKYNFKINGKTKVAEWLEQHPDEYKQLREETNELIAKQNELDLTAIDPETDGKIDSEEPEDGIIPDEILMDESN